MFGVEIVQAAVDLAAQLVEREPAVLLGLEAAVLVGLRVQPGREQCDDAAHDD